MESLDDEGEEYLFKVVIIGDSAVGKSNLLSRYARKSSICTQRPQSTLSFRLRAWRSTEKKLRLRFGIPPVRNACVVTSAYYRGALIVYDSVLRWLEELLQ
ncbi:putative small GTPase, P-loop containing nucleoside triphosphate hydrolase [Helianthus annuus]|nr:putative small GTPase, P-loop containing nucleoside triphosphate hydrolase [Helianthus annuus]